MNQARKMIWLINKWMVWVKRIIQPAHNSSYQCLIIAGVISGDCQYMAAQIMFIQYIHHNISKMCSLMASFNILEA